ncbi:MAG: hypothetical protein M9916_09155 [Crocinitomicaceae bacterium]|nr:hypothetical protein [Crocinitomicaceae bacterium]
MNKFFNALLFALFLPTLFLAILIGFDIPIPLLRTTGANLSYNKEALFVLGLLILVINLRRTIKRWSAMRLVNQVDKYKWSTLVTKERVKRVYVYNFSEAVIMALAGYSIYSLCSDAWMALIGFMFGAIDNVIFGIYGGATNKFRVGMTSKALLAGDRDVIVIYFKGLRRVTTHLQTVFFDFKDDLQLSFPIDLIPDEKRQEFFQELKGVVDESKVYFQNDL